MLFLIVYLFQGVRAAASLCLSLGASQPYYVKERKNEFLLPCERGTNPNLYEQSNSFLHYGSFFVFKYIMKKAIKKGSFKLIYPDGREEIFGQTENKQGMLEVRFEDVNLFYNLIKDSDIALGEAYMDNKMVVSNNSEGLLSFLRIILLNRNEIVQQMSSFSFLSPVSLISSAMYTVGNYYNLLAHMTRSNTIEGSKKNIREHYDIGNSLYKLFLDETMTYSSGINGQVDGLKQSQYNKIDRMIKQARINKDSLVLEIGCGWGSTAIRAVETTGCKVIGLTISLEQYNYAIEKVKERKMEDRISLLICDYREYFVKNKQMIHQFDAVISIGRLFFFFYYKHTTVNSYYLEMLEAVGHENIPEYFSVVETALSSDGIAVVQGK